MTIKEFQDKIRDCNPDAEIIIIDIHDDEFDIIEISGYKTQVHLMIDDR